MLNYVPRPLYSRIMGVRFRFVSLNINGYAKLQDFPDLRDFVAASSVACFQETGDTENKFCIPGFSKFETPAVRTRGKSSCGIATFFSHADLGACVQSQLITDLDWVLPVLIESQETALRLLCINVYAPR